MITPAMPAASTIQTTASKSFLFIGDSHMNIARYVSPDQTGISVTANTKSLSGVAL